MVSVPNIKSVDRLAKAGLVRSIPVRVSGRDTLGTHDDRGETLNLIGPVSMPLAVARREVAARWYVAASSGPGCGGASDSEHLSAVAFGDLDSQPKPPLVRIHSTCFTGDVLGSLRCDCGPQLSAALYQMGEDGAGLLVYMAAHEGRGIGSWAKAAAYLLQEEGLDTYEANRALGFEDDHRDFSHAAAIIHHLLGDRPFRLLTNNPDKVEQVRACGLEGVVRQSHVVGVCSRNQAYLRAKAERGHAIPLASVSSVGD